MERVDALDLNVYSAAFRTYDPALGRWWQQDPVQDGMPGLSSYHQTFGNPVAYADPLGLWPEPGLNRNIGESAGEQWMREHGMGAGYTNPVFQQMPAQNQFSSNLNSFVSGLPWGSRATLNATGNGEFDYILWQGRAYYSNYGSLLGGLSLSGYGSLFLTDASYQYGNSFSERAGNFGFWWDFATNSGAFADDPNIIKMDIGDNPVSWLISGAGVLGAMRYGRAGAATIGGFKSIGAAGRSLSNVKLIKSNMLKRAGIDAHALKTEFLGPKGISKFDLYKHTETGEVLIMQKGGVGEAIFTGIFL